MKKIILTLIVMILIFGCKTPGKPEIGVSGSGKGVVVNFIPGEPGNEINVRTPNFVGVKFVNYITEPVEINFAVYDAAKILDESGSMSLDGAFEEKRYIPFERNITYRLMNTTTDYMTFYAIIGYKISRDYNPVICAGEFKETCKDQLSGKVVSNGANDPVTMSINPKVDKRENGINIRVTFNINNVGVGKTDNLRFSLKDGLGLSCSSDNSDEEGTSLKLKLEDNKASVVCFSDPDKPLQIIGENSYTLNTVLEYDYSYTASTAQISVNGFKVR